ncbi:hypothetical protein [Asticcacaulis sp. AC402]|uniref:hypothetical protein n=1 Tax=Asticcacaulis sp. AC402 TaxID=1282361 RepID=UPI0003C3F4E4|nr:hypothetical protein [Asticcacaulis sp. AC402]ESQ77703.1 membrane protein [Asticcacaulis sp. AC402]
MSDTAALPKSRDSHFFLFLMVVIWIGMFAGFGGDIAKKYERMQGLHYPLIVHIHAAAYVGWMVLQTVQILLIRAGKYSLHKLFGSFGILLLMFMLIVGPWAEIDFERRALGTSGAKTAFMVIAMAGVVMFGVLASAAIVLRANAQAHKRLMMLALISITTAGYGRWLTGPILGLLESVGLSFNFTTFWLAFNAAPIVLTLMMAVRDLMHLGRLVPAFVWGAVFMTAVQVASCWVYFWPAWKSIAEQWLTG